MDKMNGMMEEEGVDLVKNVEEANPYPSADKQFASARKYMTYESISTGVGGKK
jgi:hypothetical protein